MRAQTPAVEMSFLLRPCLSPTRRAVFVPTLGLALVLVTLSFALAAEKPKEAPAAPANAADLEAKVRAINEQAKALDKARDSEEIEKLRRMRWEAIATFADAAPKEEPTDKWLKAYSAISAVDGAENVDNVDLLVSVGLVNELRYKEACETLRTSWRQMIQADNGPVLGEVAVRMFEVAQQAKGLYEDALDPSSPNNVATNAELLEALKTADKRDPCCIMARALAFYLEPADTTEAFLRAEVRKNFKSRQQSLVRLSHPLILPPSQIFDQRTTKTNRENNAPATPTSIENADSPLMPWHATVEFDKAQSLSHLVEDLEYTKAIMPNWQRIDVVGNYRFPSYDMPGQILSGLDSMKQPFAFFQGRALIGQTVDKNGLTRSAVMYLNEKREWDYRYLDILWRVPTKEQLESSLALQEKQGLVGVHIPRDTFELGRETYRLYDFPVRDTPQLMKENAQVLCVKDRRGFSRLRFVPNKNAATDVSEMRPSREYNVLTTPLVRIQLAYIQQKNDVTKHALNELMEINFFNPLVIVSNKDSKNTKPLFFPAANGKPPYLELDDGNKLWFSIEGSENSPCCYISFTGATAYMPMSVQAIPDGILFGTAWCKAFMSLLQDSGMSEESSASYIRSSMTDPPPPPPPKFMTMLKARSQSQRKARGDVFQELLREKGLNVDKNDMQLDRRLGDLFSVYGFRYLRDNRGNWIMAKGLAEDASVKTNPNGLPGSKEKELTDYPFEYRAKDGKNRIDTAQFYSWPDYEQISFNIIDEHLRKALTFHPCPPMLELLAKKASQKLVHPEQNSPDYLKSAAVSFVAKELPKDVGANLPRLTFPYPTWMCTESVNQQATLTALHNAYCQKIAASAQNQREVAVSAFVLRYIAMLRPYCETQQQTDNLDQNEQTWTTIYRTSTDNHFISMKPILVVQLESARNYAFRRYFHRSIVFYNDFLAELHALNPTDSSTSLFTTVPTTASMQGYISELDSLIHEQMLCLNIQVELAGVLNAGGLRPSALYVWQRTADDYEFLLKPSLKLAEEMLESYGLTLSKRAHKLVAEMDSAVQLARDGIFKYGLRHDWRGVGDAGLNKAVEVAFSKKFTSFAKKLELDGDGELPAEEESKLPQELSDLMQDEGLDFERWLTLKRSLTNRPALAFRTDQTVPPWCACPISYTEQVGFSTERDAVAGVLRGNNAEQIKNWCKIPIDAANENPDAADACFLLGWYWHDRRQPALARAAFMNSAHLQLADAKQNGKANGDLIRELNGYRALITSGAIAEDLPGISSFKTDFSVLLKAQLADWDKRWFAEGYYGPHASEQRLVLQSRALEATAGMWRRRQVWRNERYFLPDYTFTYGPIPDFIVEKLFKSPDLFKKLTKEELEAREKDATEAGRWTLVTESDGINFFDGLKGEWEVKRDLVFLAD